MTHSEKERASLVVKKKKIDYMGSKVEKKDSTNLGTLDELGQRILTFRDEERAEVWFMHKEVRKPISNMLCSMNTVFSDS